MLDTLGFSLFLRDRICRKKTKERKKEQPITTIHRAKRTKADKDRQTDRERSATRKTKKKQSTGV